MNRTLLDECFRVSGRTIWRMAPEEAKPSQSMFLLDHFNLKPPHQGYSLTGRIPAQPPRGAFGRKKHPPLVPKEDDDMENEAA